MLGVFGGEQSAVGRQPYPAAVGPVDAGEDVLDGAACSHRFEQRALVGGHVAMVAAGTLRSLPAAD